LKVVSNSINPFWGGSICCEYFLDEESRPFLLLKYGGVDSLPDRCRVVDAVEKISAIIATS